MDKVKTGFLFANPFVRLWCCSKPRSMGASSTSYNESESGEEADAKAIAADWISVGEDIQAAI